MYKILFWLLVVVIAIYNFKYINTFFIYVYYMVATIVIRVQQHYMELYVQKHGWTRYKYKSLRQEDNGKLFTHPDMWVHSNHYNKRYGNDGEYVLYESYLIAKGKK